MLMFTLHSRFGKIIMKRPQIKFHKIEQVFLSTSADKISLIQDLTCYTHSQEEEREIEKSIVKIKMLL